jgi:hypothetical protein
VTNITIQIGANAFEATLYDTPTAQAILKALPFESSANTWGDEIYFHTPAQRRLEPGAQAVVEVGDLAYWPSMPAFCIFFGPTPASSNDQPQAASAVNVFGRLKEVDLKKLRQIGGGEKVIVSKASTSP